MRHAKYAARAQFRASKKRCQDFWDQRPEGVLAARVGYFDEGDAIGDMPCIAASVKPSP